MKTFRFLIFAFLSCRLCALELNFLYGKDGDDFSVLTLKNVSDFFCHKGSKDIYDESIECVIPQIPKEGFLPIETKFFALEYKIQDGAFVLSIKSKFKQQLFLIQNNVKDNLFLDYDATKKTIFTPQNPLPEQKNLFKEGASRIPRYSKHFEIVAYKNSLPLITPKAQSDTLGLNFPIKLTGESYVPGLGIDNLPLEVQKANGYEDYKTARQKFLNGNYADTLNALKDALDKNPESIFRVDLEYFKTLSLYHLERFDDAVKSGKHWLKTNAADPRAAEIIYIIGSSYNSNMLYLPAHRMFERAIKEYPNSDYAALSYMKMAQRYARDEKPQSARELFSKALTGAKSVDSGVHIALNWALFESRFKKDAHAIMRAKELIDKIAQAKSTFLSTHPNQSREAILTLIDRSLFLSAAKLAEKIVSNTKRQDDIHEFALFNLGLMYEKGGEYDKAHEANNKFISTYGTQLPNSIVVQKRDDNLLFSLRGNDKDTLENYDYLMQKYPNTDTAQKAADLKAALLLRLKRYSDVLTLSGKVNDSVIDTAHANLIQIAYDDFKSDLAPTQDMRSKLCSVITQHVGGMKSYAGLVGKSYVFECLYERKLFKIAKQIVPVISDLAKESQKDAKKLEEYKTWLYNDAKVLSALGDSKNALIAIGDLEALGLEERKDILFSKFANLASLNSGGLDSRDAMREVYSKLFEDFRDDRRMIQVYAKMLEQSIYVDNNQRRIFSQNLIELQDKYKLYEYTPFARLELIEALKINNDFKGALGVVLQIRLDGLDDATHQKVLYTKGALELRLDEKANAKNSFEKCTSIKTPSPWRTLCTQSLELAK